MSGNPSGLWWVLALVDGAVGAGIFIYGVRQREGWSLACGVALSVLPMVSGDGLALLALSTLVCGAYIGALKYF
jgi:hypothetical protein